jgi:hypothetical protein
MLLTPNPYSFRPATGGRGVSPLTYRQTTTRDHQELQIARAIDHAVYARSQNRSGPFSKGQRKDDLMQRRLGAFKRKHREGVVFIGVAQEKASRASHGAQGFRP